MKINISHIDRLQNEKAIKSLAFALLIKDTYVSSSVKNYNPHSLQKKLAGTGFKFHHITIKKYTDTLISFDLAIIKNNCLIVKKLHSDEQPKIRIKKGHAKNFKDYIHFIRGAILKRKIWQAEYVYNKKSLSKELLANPRSPGEYRTGKRLRKNYGELRIDETSFSYKQSIRSLANEFNCSIGEIYTTIKYLISKGWLTVQRFFRKVGVFLGDLDYLPEKSFVKDGFLFIVDCNSYSITNNNDSKK
ncbi:MAG: hypothetical protein ACOC2U_03610 [bacterium]